MIDLSTVGNVEATEFSLCALYSKHGYLPFKMSKFEEYDLYVRNKDFLISDNVITFNDTDGRLLAMKPDVTLSIIKNSSVEAGCKSKVYYSENVYRVSPRLRRFGELRQTGLECVGDTDIIDTCEVVSLAAESLALISDKYVLDISHLGILSAVISAVSADAGFKKEATRLLSEKNRHELSALCKSVGAAERPTEILLSFIDLYGEMGDVLSVLAPISFEIGCMDAYSELERLCMLLSSREGAERINLDFSVVNDMSYYNGIVFTGFIEGIPDGVLAGGEYGALVQRMGKAAGAVGFAVYLDMLEELNADSSEYDVDVLIVYDERAAIEDVLYKKAELIAEGKSVSLQRAIPEKLRYKELVRIEG